MCFLRCSCVHVRASVFALHTKWNAVLEGLLVSWRKTRSTSEFLLQVQRTKGLVFPVLHSSQICSRWVLHSMHLFYLLVAGKDYEDGIQAVLVAHQFRVCTPSLGFDSVPCVVVHPELYSRKKDKTWNKEKSSTVTGKKTCRSLWAAQQTVSTWWWRKETADEPCSHMLDQQGKTRRDGAGLGRGGLLHFLK